MLIRRRRNRERKSTCQYPAKDVTRMKPCGNPLLYGEERKSRRSLRRNSEAR
jgi:hypothetical protein